MKIRYPSCPQKFYDYVCVALALALLQVSGVGRSQTSNLIYEKLVVPPTSNINGVAVGEGEQIDNQTGRLTLNTIDVAIPGNNEIPVELRRSKDTGVVGYGSIAAPLGDWILDLPRVSLTHAKNIGWANIDQSRPYKNCSVSQQNYIYPSAGNKPPENKFVTFTYWVPPTLYLPDGGGVLLYNTGELPVAASMDKVYWRTIDQAIATCLPSLANSIGGLPNNAGYEGNEGYQITTAKGFRYRFDWLATDNSREVFTTYAPTGYPAGTVLTATMSVQNVSLYPTRVEDKFGNWITYQYSNAPTEKVKLLSIVASDGRSISLTYDTDGFLNSVNSGGRSWVYSYEGNGSKTRKVLVEVRNPDNSKWTYAGGAIFSSSPTMDPYYGSCINQNNWMKEQTQDSIDNNNYNYVQYVVNSPSGAQTTYRFSQGIFGKSGVPKNCYVSGWISSPFFGMIQEPQLPVWYAATRLVYKSVSGPGLTESIWKYGYISRHGFLPMTDGYTRTRILNPDGSLDSYTYGNTYNSNEGLLLNTIRSKDGIELSRTDFTYELGASNPNYPKRVGIYPSTLDAGYTASFLRPLINKTVKEPGITYVWRVAQDCNGASCLDVFARPLKTVESSQ